MANYTLITGKVHEIAGLSKTQTGKLYTQIILQSTDGKYVDNLPIFFRDETAKEICSNYHPGEYVLVEGKLNSRPNQSRDGHIYYNLSVSGNRIKKILSDDDLVQSDRKVTKDELRQKISDEAYNKGNTSGKNDINVNVDNQNDSNTVNKTIDMDNSAKSTKPEPTVPHTEDSNQVKNTFNAQTTDDSEGTATLNFGDDDFFTDDEDF